MTSDRAVVTQGSVLRERVLLTAAVGLTIVAGVVFLSVPGLVAGIEDDVRVAVAESGVEGLDVRVDGRDAVLSGVVVGTERELDDLREAIASRDGVRRVVLDDVRLASASTEIVRAPDPAPSNDGIPDPSAEARPEREPTVEPPVAPTVVAAPPVASTPPDVEESEPVLDLDAELADLAAALSSTSLFDRNSVANDPAAEPSYDRLAEVLTLQPDVRLIVTGHTDSRGARALNGELSHARAHVIVDALVARGISPQRLAGVGAGPTEPIASDDTEEGRAANRRVTFLIRRSDN